jgi:radical SAM protein with 4Fe4S-binding SPASM domain
MNWKSFTQRFAARRGSPAARVGIKPGLYHYMRPYDGAQARFHLRVNTGGSGVLLANAASAVRLHPSGVIIAKGLLEGQAESAIVEKLERAFRGVTAQQAAADIKQVLSLIASLERPHREYPILNPADPSFSPRAAPLERPMSADVPLCKPFYMEPILRRLWDEGIPHATIVVGKNPAEKDMIRAVEKGEDLGLITGVRGRGSDLAHCARIPELAQAGLDHLDIYCLSTDAQIHDSLVGQNDYKFAVKALVMAQKREVCPVAVLALVKPTLATIDGTLAAIADHGVVNACLFAIATTDPAEQAGGALLADELVQAAAMAAETAERYRLRLLWYPPVRYNPELPLGDQVCRGPRTSGDSAIRVDTDGYVVPARGPYHSPGNIVKESWDVIAKRAVYVDYWRRLQADTHCPTCPGLAICAADCPRNPEGWAAAEPKKPRPPAVSETVRDEG